MRTSLTAKFNLLTIAVVLMTAISIGSLVLYREVTTTTDALVQRGLITAGILAQASEYGVYTENTETLRKVVASARMDPDFFYMVVQNAENNVLIQEMHDQVTNSFITEALKFRQPSRDSLFVEFVDPTSKQRYIDIRVAIVSKGQANLFGDESSSQLP